MTTVTLKVKPAVFRFVDNNFPKVKGKYDVRKSYLHEMIVAGLIRSGNDKTAASSRNFDKWKSIEVIISGYSAAQYGTNLTNENQCRINVALYSILINEICTEVMSAAVFAGRPKNTVMREILCSRFYEENELNLACISKIYQRKYAEKESDMRIMFS